VNLFRLFVTELLPLLRTKVILLTGQWLKPALELLAPGRTKLPDSHQNRLGFVTSGDVEATLRSDRIVRWYSQNMFAVPKTYQDKYRGLPYGIDYTKAEQYRKCLRDFGNVPKKDTLFLSPLRNTSKVREVLLNLSEYRNAMRAFTGKNGARRIENYSYYCERLARALPTHVTLLSFVAGGGLAVMAVWAEALWLTVIEPLQQLCCNCTVGVGGPETLEVLSLLAGEDAADEGREDLCALLKDAFAKMHRRRVRITRPNLT